MKLQGNPGRWLIAPALLLAFCSRGNAPSFTGPSVGAPATATQNGRVGTSAAGDIKVGDGTLGFLNLAIWGFNGDPGAGGYVEPGGTYAITPGVEVKLWATLVQGSPANPKFKVEWGDGSEASTSGCGGCKATHTYAGAGPYTVKASLDDRVSTMVTRTFVLGSGTTTAPGSGPVIAGPGACRSGGLPLSISPGNDMVVCDDPTDQTCEQDFATLCPAGWNLCTMGQHHARNDAWSFAPGAAALGEIGCRGAGGGNGAGHYTVYSGRLSIDEAFNLYYGSSRSTCVTDYGCNEQNAVALCCRPTATCGNGVVDSPEEQCDDGNLDDTDACLSTCWWKNPADHGFGGLNVG